jgi:predicted Zn-dependent protease with MMP-like domain
MRFADTNKSPIAVEDLDVDILKAIALEAVGLYEGRTLGGRLPGIRTQIGHV